MSKLAETISELFDSTSNHAEAIDAEFDSVRRVVEFAARSRLLFAFHRNVETGSYMECIRCSGEGPTQERVEHIKGCPVQLAREVLVQVRMES